MAETAATSNLGWDNFFSTTTTASITDTTTTIPLATAPSPTEGFLVLDPGGANEIIFYNSKSGNNVIVPSTDDRGRGDSTAAAHSSGITVKMNTVGPMFEALQDGTALSSGAIVNANVSNGMVVQHVYTQTGAVATTTTQMPADDTIPQNTEGGEFMTLAITPKSATNILVIEVNALLSGNTSASQYLSGALFQDSTAGALRANPMWSGALNAIFPFTLRHVMVAGTTSATTFKFRAGQSGSGTMTLNGSNGGRFMGGVADSSIVIKEYKAS